VHYSPYDPHGGVHDGPLVTGMPAMDTALSICFMNDLLCVWRAWYGVLCIGTKFDRVHNNVVRVPLVAA
jgi:hypothetical protein